MKRIVCLLLAALLIAGLVGCGKEDPQDPQMPSIKVGDGNKDTLNDPVNQPGNTVSAGAPAITSEGLLLPDEASTLALQHAGLEESDVVGLHAALEIDDGVPQYEVEFSYNHVEYEYCVHAQTGEILSWEKGD